MEISLGYAQFPEDLSSDPDTDGVVIHWRAFGRGAGFNLMPNFNLGRTATHEVGHWIGLTHIWGDDNGACSGSDMVADTPNQGNNSLNVPTFPTVDNCTTTNPGIMFMNYMDYTDDVGMNLFTNGQKGRMRANFDPGGFREDANYAVGVSITDSSPICASDTLTLQNQPVGSTITWSSSNPTDLSINPTTGVATRQNNFDGSVTVTASIGGACGTVNITRNVWVGRPFIEYVSFANCDNEGGYFCTSCYGNTIEVASETPNATFEARLLSFPSLTVVYTSPTIYSSDVPGIFNYIPIPNNGYYLLELRGTNECGTTDWFGNEVEYVDCSLFRMAKQFTAYPVPFKDELNINLLTKTGSKNEFSGKNESTKEIYLVDFKTSAVVYRTTVSDNNHVIDTKQIAPGQYVLMVKGSVTESLLVMKK